MNLRLYQQELVDRIKNELKSGKKSVVAVLGCGGGKSVIQATIAKSATDKGNQVLFLVHRKELCEQIANTFATCGVDFNLCDVSMVQTVARRLKTIKKPALIITDECHHILSNTYMRIMEYFPEAVKLGFTATPIRLGSGGLGKAFETMVIGVSTQWLIDNNYLSPYKYYSIKLADAKGIKVQSGDYRQQDIANLMERGAIYGDTVSNYLKISPGKKTIVYCASIKSSKATAEQFCEHGITAYHLDGDTPKAERKQIVQDFRDNKIQVLCNVDLFGEGLDVPDCECVILLRPTKSLTLYIQQSMRSMRYMPDKTAIIIDHVANVYEHGLPDDDRTWTLAAKKKKQVNEIKVKDCPKCFSCMDAGVKICLSCGHVFEIKERQDKEKIDMELKEIKRKELAKKPYEHCEEIDNFEDMRLFQKAKGYKFAWVIHRCIAQGIEIPSQYNVMMRHLSVRR